MKKFNKTKSITIILSSIIFITTLSVFISFIIDPSFIMKEKYDENEIEIIELNIGEEIISSDKVNSLVQIENSINGYKKIFSKILLVNNFPKILEDTINISKEINYHYNELNSKIFFNMLNDKELSMKIELVPKNNHFYKYLSKFKLIIK